MVDSKTTVKAIKVLAGHLKDMDKLALRAIAKDLAEEVAREYAQAMRDAPTSRVYPEGWGTETRSERWDSRRMAAVTLVGQELRRHGGEWLPSLVRHAFGSGEGPETWRVVERREIVTRVDPKAVPETEKGNGKINFSDVALAGFGAETPQAIQAMGLTWSVFAEMVLRRFMVSLRVEIETSGWRFPSEVPEKKEEKSGAA